jgi:hypothetical protein
MAGLMAQIATQRSIALAHRQAQPLARSIIGLGQIHGDWAILMASHQSMALRIRSVSEEVKKRAPASDPRTGGAKRFDGFRQS